MSQSQLINRPQNNDWVRQAFLLPEKAVTAADMIRRTLTTAAFKFTDTTIGGNFSINTPPQYTRYADIKVGGQPNRNVFRRTNGSGIRSSDDGANDPYLFDSNGHPIKHKYRISASRGMGRYYSEAVDDNGQYVTMRFGVPEFNSLMGFFANFYHHGAATLARTGRGESLMYMIGKAAGITLSLPFWPVIQGGRAFKFFNQSPASKFYYLKPAMPLYWKAVSTILNGISVNMGLVPQSLAPEQSKLYANPEDMVHNKSVAAKYHGWMPDVINEHGVIDAFSVATRAQRLANQFNEEIRDQVQGGERWENIQTAIARWLEKEIQPGAKEWPNLDAYIKAYSDELEGNKSSLKAEDGDSKNADAEKVDNRDRYSEDGGSASFWDFFHGERRDGASFVTFRVDFSNTAQETFSNSTREADISSKVNGMSQQSRSVRFSIADGNFGSDAISNTIESIVGSAKDVVMGVAEGIGVSGLAAFGGNALVDIPKMWDASTANLPRMDFTIQLRSPYGNKMSRMRNLFLPLSMLLAGALPLSAGRHAFTSPFLVEAYCKGRAGIRLGMVESLSITRGVGNLGWNVDDEPLGIDVTLSIVDMTSILHMPIATMWSGVAGAASALGEAVGGSTGAMAASTLFSSTFDEDNAFTDYLSTLASLSYQDMVYPTNRWRINVANQMATFQSWRSPARWANWAMGTFPGRVLNALSENTDRLK